MSESAQMVGMWQRIPYALLLGITLTRCVSDNANIASSISVTLTHIQVVFRKPINLLPGQRIALYLHSGLPDDLGIQYQTYNKDSIVAEDDHIVLFPGVGHTVSRCYVCSCMFTTI